MPVSQVPTLWLCCTGAHGQLTSGCRSSSPRWQAVSLAWDSWERQHKCWNLQNLMSSQLLGLTSLMEKARGGGCPDGRRRGGCCVSPYAQSPDGGSSRLGTKSMFLLSRAPIWLGRYTHKELTQEVRDQGGSSERLCLGDDNTCAKGWIDFRRKKGMHSQQRETVSQPRSHLDLN